MNKTLKRVLGPVPHISFWFPDLLMLGIGEGELKAEIVPEEGSTLLRCLLLDPGHSRD